MKRFALSILLPLALAGCGWYRAPNAPANASLWGVPIHYRQGELSGTLLGLAEHPFGGACQVTVLQVQTWVVAHEAAHCWVEAHGMPVGWDAAPCMWQSPVHCSPEEAFADRVGWLIEQAGCTPGDLGWPGMPRAECVLPDPARVPVFTGS